MKPGTRGWILGLGLLAVAALSQRLQTPVEEADWSKNFSRAVLQGEELTELPVSSNAREALGVDRYRFVETRGMGWAPVWIYAGYYAGQRTNAQVHAPEHCYPGAGWEIMSSRVLEEKGRRLRELRIENHGEKRLVWYASRTRSGQLSGALALKRDQLLSTLQGHARDALLLRLSTPILEVEGKDRAEAPWISNSPIWQMSKRPQALRVA